MAVKARPPAFDPSVYVHSPADLGVLHLEHYEHIKAHPGITWGVASIDNVAIPMRPGSLTIICGRPGSGKTSLLARQAKLTARDIADRKAQAEECVIYVSWEQHAEELEAYFQSDSTYTHTDYSWGRVDMDAVRRKTYGRAALPLWVIGYSNKHIKSQTKPLALDIVFNAVQSMVQEYRDSPRPVLLCMDYAQIIPETGRYRNRYEAVKGVVNDTKQLALQIGCPVILGVQARREVDDYKYQVPSMRDGYESAGIEHVPDKMYGVWRPWKTHRHDQPVDVFGHMIPNSPDLVVIKLNKQRGDDGDKIFILRFDPAELRLDDLALDVQEPVW